MYFKKKIKDEIKFSSQTEKKNFKNRNSLKKKTSML